MALRTCSFRTTLPLISFSSISLHSQTTGCRSILEVSSIHICLLGCIAEESKLHKDGRPHVFTGHMVVAVPYAAIGIRHSSGKGRMDRFRYIKKKHWDATHNCSAYMIGENNLIQKANDDGEPSGTAGVPMLEVLKKRDLKDTVVVVTRYFGGSCAERDPLSWTYPG